MAREHQPEAMIFNMGSPTTLLNLPVTFNIVELVEDLRDGQRVTRHSIMNDDGELAAGLTVGNRRLNQVPDAPE